MLDRRSQSPMATSQKLGTARAIFDDTGDQGQTKRLTRSYRNTDNQFNSSEQQQPIGYSMQVGSYVMPQDVNSQNSRKYIQESFEYKKPETDNLNFRTVQSGRPIEPSSFTVSNYQNFEYKKPDGGRAGSYIQPALTTTQEQYTSNLNFQTKSTYEPIKFDTKYDKYDISSFDKYKTTFEQPKTYEKFEAYKFEPIPSYQPIQTIQTEIKTQSIQQNPEYQQSHHSIQSKQKPSVINTHYQQTSSFNQEPHDQNFTLQRPTYKEDPITLSQVNQTKNVVQNTQQIKYPPSQKDESITIEHKYRPTTPVLTNQQQTSQIQKIDYPKLQEPLHSYKPSFVQEQQSNFNISKLYNEEIIIVENEANEKEFNAGCVIF